MAFKAEPVRLSEETLAAYVEYVRAAEAAFSLTLQPEGPFLWWDTCPDVADRVREGQIITRMAAEGGPLHVTYGLIHDWIGLVCIPKATIENTLALVQDYDRHKEIYRPEVMESKLVDRRGNEFDIFLRLLKKKIITVVLDTDHHVEYEALSGTRWWCRSRTTRIAEIEDAGKPTEWARSPDMGYGFLWRLSSYWRFEQREEGVWVECRAISLTRDVPKSLAWIIEPIVNKLPRESLASTLEATRRACGGMR